MANRQLIYVPKIEPDTFLFFYFEGDTGRSYSFRDYRTDPPKLTYAKAYPYSADDIMSMATWQFDAEVISTKNVGYWREEIGKLNQRYLKKALGTERPTRAPAASDDGVGQHEAAHPAQQMATPSEGGSSSFPILGRQGQQIRSVDEWFRYAPPKMGSKHWKDGRSAKELAKAWLKTGVPRMPDEFAALLRSQASTMDFVVETAFPERITGLHAFGGGPRNHDLILLGRAGERRVLVSVEAKADESFGELIREELRTAKPSSKVPDRIDLLSQSIFGRPIDPALGNLRYQLVHGLAGTLIEARNQKASLAVFVVHEFISSQTRSDEVDRNHADFAAFVRAFPEMGGVAVRSGKLIEGITVPGGRYVPNDIPVLVGSVASKLGW
jgi:hypothetical protein